LEDGGHAQFFAGHLVDDLRHGGVGGYLGEGFGGVHQVAYTGEADSQAAARVEVGEVGGVKAAAATEFEGQGVSESEHDGGGGGGSEIERAGFGGDADVEEYVGRLGEAGVGCAGQGDEGGGEPLEDREDEEEFFGFAAVGEGDDGVAGSDHAEVSVDGFGGVEEVCGGSGGAEGGGDLVGDDAGFADSGEEDVLHALGCEEMADGLSEGGEHGGVEAESEVNEGRGFDADEV
jgi:hypothetical protein